MTPDTLPLLVLAACLAARCAYYRSEPSWKWLLPGACAALALLPGSAPAALFVAVIAVALGAAV
jgi:hypothetical protein